MAKIDVEREKIGAKKDKMETISIRYLGVFSYFFNYDQIHGQVIIRPIAPNLIIY